MTFQPVIVRDHAGDLPAAWDQAAAGHPFLQRDVLSVLETANPCGQRYHMTEGDESASVAVSYRHRLNLLTFGRGCLAVPVRILGIPCSVSSGGVCLKQETSASLLNHLRGLRGILLVLNSGEAGLSGFASGSTLPSCRLEVTWPNFDVYVAAMRSHYRYRVRKALSRWTGIKATKIQPADFDAALYPMYEAVYRRSRYKLEKLSAAFFQTFPAELTVFSTGQQPIAFVQTLREGPMLHFLFVGMDYTERADHDTYLNILLHVIREGIESGCTSIDLGQTTETTKTRLGCRVVPRHLHARHSNPIAHRLLRVAMGALQYRAPERENHVFS